jgi:hypothetical protein
MEDTIGRDWLDAKLSGDWLFLGSEPSGGGSKPIEAEQLVAEAELHGALCDTGRDKLYCTHCLVLLVERLLRMAQRRVS